MPRPWRRIGRRVGVQAGSPSKQVSSAMSSFDVYAVRHQTRMGEFPSSPLCPNSFTVGDSMRSKRKRPRERRPWALFILLARYLSGAGFTHDEMPLYCGFVADG
jgi:hypothetical protein